MGRGRGSPKCPSCLTGSDSKGEMMIIYFIHLYQGVAFISF